MVKCLFPDCKTNTATNYCGSNVMLHRLPDPKKNKQKYDDWINAVPSSYKINSRMYICSKHFKSSDYAESDIVPGKFILNRNAIPCKDDKEVEMGVPISDKIIDLMRPLKQRCIVGEYILSESNSSSNQHDDSEGEDSAPKRRK